MSTATQNKTGLPKDIQVEVGTVQLANERKADGSPTTKYRGYMEEATLEGPAAAIWAGQIRFSEDTGYGIDQINDRIKAMAQEAADKILSEGADESGRQLFKNLPPFPGVSNAEQLAKDQLAVEVVVRVYRCEA